jgi:hypothetical protein
LPYLTRFLLGATVASAHSSTSANLECHLEACIVLCDLLAGCVLDEAQQSRILFLLGSNDYLVLESLVSLLELDHPRLSESVLGAIGVLVKGNGQAASRMQLTLCPL